MPGGVRERATANAARVWAGSTDRGPSRTRNVDPLAAAMKREERRMVGRQRHATILFLGLIVAVTAVVGASGLYRSLPGSAAFVGVFVAILLSLPFNLGAHYLFVLRPMEPAVELCANSVDRARRSWAEIDGRTEMTSEPQAIRLRLGDRSDGIASGFRASSFILEGDWTSARRALDAWRPMDPLGIGQHARIAEQVSFAETGADGMGEVKRILAAIPDDRARREQLVPVAIEEARRAAARGEPVLDRMRSARLALGELSYSTLRGRQNPRTARSIYVAFFVLSFVPAVWLILSQPLSN